MALCILVGLLFYFYSYYSLSCCFAHQTATYLRSAPDEYVRGWGVRVIEDPNRFVFYCHALGSMDDDFLLLS